MRHTETEHFDSFRQLIKVSQKMAEELAFKGAVGPMLAWDAIQETGVRRFRFATVGSGNDRVLVSEMIAALRHCCYSTPVSFVLLRTQLTSPSPDLRVRATVIGFSVASENLWCSEATITERLNAPPTWVAINDERLTNLVEPVVAFVRFCHAQGLAYS